MKEQQAERERAREGGRERERKEFVQQEILLDHSSSFHFFFPPIILYRNFELTFRWDSDYFSVQKCLCFSHALCTCLYNLFEIMFPDFDSV